MQIDRQLNGDGVPRTKLLKKLRAAEMPSDAYSLFDIPKVESLCTEKTSDGVAVYYFERGIRTQERVFQSEHDACEYFFERIASWFKK